MNSENSLDPALQWAQEKYLAKDIHDDSRELAILEVKRKLLSIVDDLIRQTKQEIPFQPQIIAPFRRVRRIAEAEISTDAILIPHIGGFEIKIRRSLHPFKKRFALAHELGHTFFFNIDVDPPEREFQYRKSNYWVQEEFSCAIAREILVPEFSLRTIVEKEGLSPSISALRYLSALYQVSFDVLRLRLINDIPTWDCVILTSKVSDGRILTKSRDISKGVSHKNLVVPRSIQWNSRLSNLFYAMSSALSQTKVEDTLRIDGRDYAVESILLDGTRQTVLSLLC